MVPSLDDDDAGCTDLDDAQARDLNCTHDTPYHHFTAIWMEPLFSMHQKNGSYFNTCCHFSKHLLSLTLKRLLKTPRATSPTPVLCVPRSNRVLKEASNICNEGCLFIISTTWKLTPCLGGKCSFFYKWMRGSRRTSDATTMKNGPA